MQEEEVDLSASMVEEQKEEALDFEGGDDEKQNQDPVQMEEIKADFERQNSSDAMNKK